MPSNTSISSPRGQWSAIGPTASSAIAEVMAATVAGRAEWVNGAYTLCRFRGSPSSYWRVVVDPVRPAAATFTLRRSHALHATDRLRRQERAAGPQGRDGGHRAERIDLRAQPRVDAVNLLIDRDDLLIEADDPLVEDAELATQPVQLRSDDVLKRSPDLVVDAHRPHSSSPSRRSMPATGYSRDGRVGTCVAYPSYLGTSSLNFGMTSRASSSIECRQAVALSM